MVYHQIIIYKPKTLLSVFVAVKALDVLVESLFCYSPLPSYLKRGYGVRAYKLISLIPANVKYLLYVIQR